MICLRASWKIAGLTFWSKEKEKEKSRSDYLYQVSNSFFSYVLFIRVDHIYFKLKNIKLLKNKEEIESQLKC